MDLQSPWVRRSDILRGFRNKEWWYTGCFDKGNGIFVSFFFCRTPVADKMSFISSILFALGSALGFSLVLVMFAGLRERLALMDVPRLFSGPPIAFIVVSLLALAFMGFSGMGAN